MPSGVMGWTATRSPTRHPDTAEPVAATSPTMSPPEMNGVFTGKPGMPRRTNTSR